MDICMGSVGFSMAILVGMLFVKHIGLLSLCICGPFMPLPRLKLKGVESRLKIYGKKEEKDMGHVFHLNCRLPQADQCNDEQCAFFLAHRK